VCRPVYTPVADGKRVSPGYTPVVERRGNIGWQERDDAGEGFRSGGRVFGNGDGEGLWKEIDDGGIRRGFRNFSQVLGELVNSLRRSLLIISEVTWNLCLYWSRGLFLLTNIKGFCNWTIVGSNQKFYVTS